MTKDVIIIGGGASGLMCAISAKKNNKNISVAIIEKNDRVGKKLLSTGNGRCNLTNKNITLENYCGSFKNQLGKIISEYNTNRLLSYFEELGLMTFCDNDGRYYPVSKQATSVLDVLRFACERLGVEIFCKENIKSIKKTNNRFVIKTDNSDFVCEKLVIANGSKASPKLGGNSSCTDYLKNFGHTFVPFSPALCPVKVNSDILKSLKGIRATAKTSLFDKNNKLIKTEKGEIQFTESALSGICIFNLSLYTAKNYIISVDLLPDHSFNEVIDIISGNKILFADCELENIFTGIFQKRITQAILKMSNIREFSKSCKNLSNQEIKAIAGTVKNMCFTVTENSPFEQAQVALGGVKGNEIDEKTMQSKLIKNLYVCGEAIDICGDCGGYNLHFAFSSGIIAGEHL